MLAAGLPVGLPARAVPRPVDIPASGSFSVLLRSLGTTEPAAPPPPGSRTAGQTGVAGGGRTTPS
jgi:hypothetical protein